VTCSSSGPQPPSEQEDALPAVNLCYVGNIGCKEWLANTKDNTWISEEFLVGDFSNITKKQPSNLRKSGVTNGEGTYYSYHCSVFVISYE